MNKNFTIDVTNDINNFIEDTQKNYIKYCNYPQILKVNENDRIPLLVYIWKNNTLINLIKKVQEKFPQYDYTILNYICNIENARITNYCHMQRYLKDFKNRGIANFVQYYTSEESQSFYNKNYKKNQKWARLVHIEDMVHATNIFKRNDNSFSNYIYSTPIISCDDKNIDKIFLFKNGNYIEMGISEFKTYCEQKNIIYPLWLPPEENKVRIQKRLELMKKINKSK